MSESAGPTSVPASRVQWHHLINTVPKLTDQNYHLWKFGVTTVLRRAKCLTTLSEDKPTEPSDDWIEHAEDAFTIINLTIDPSQYLYVQGAEDGWEAWLFIRTLYEKPSRANRIKLKRMLYTTKHIESDPIREYIDKISLIRNQLTGIGIDITDDDVIDVMIINLDHTWSNIAGSLISSNTLRLGEVLSALLDEGDRRTTEKYWNETANAAYSNKKRDPACYACGRTGHMQRDCRILKKARAMVRSGDLSSDSSSESESEKKKNRRKRKEKKSADHVGVVLDALPDMSY